VAITFDGTAKIIQLDGAATVSIRGIYSRWVDWAATHLGYLPAFAVVADPPTVPVYATLMNGWLVRPAAGSYTLTLNDGFLYRYGGGDPIAPVTSGTEPRIRYENPVIAVGYSTASPQQADIDAIRAKTDQLEFLVTGVVSANITHVNEIHVGGAGSPLDPWGPE
jgi:hypothetical protein